MRYINEWKENERVIDHYLCKQKQSLKTKTGKTYYSLKLQDKTGVADAKVWELHDDIQDFEENEVIKVDGTVLLYNGDVQIKVNRIRRSLEGEYEPRELIPRTEKDIDALHDQLMGYIDSITHPHLQQLVRHIITEEPTISKALRHHSAAKAMHHGYLGGLLEHTVCVVELCDFLAPRYKNVDRDMLMAAAILHDIAKIFELTPMPSNKYTDDGQMLGHIYLGAELVSRTAAGIPGFPPVVESLLKHAILAHHGEYEFGSPKLPATLEAFILHAADNMDAKIKVYEEHFTGYQGTETWTGFHRTLGRYMRKSDY